MKIQWIGSATKVYRAISTFRKARGFRQPIRETINRYRFVALIVPFFFFSDYGSVDAGRVKREGEKIRNQNGTITKKTAAEKRGSRDFSPSRKRRRHVPPPHTYTTIGRVYYAYITYFHYLLVRRLVPVFAAHSVHVDHRHFFGRFLGRRVESGRFRHGGRVDRRFLFVRRLFLAGPPAPDRKRKRTQTHTHTHVSHYRREQDTKIRSRNA